MNGKRIAILISAIAVAGLIVWHDLPLEFPWVVNILLLFVKLFAVLAATVFAFILAGGGKKPTG